MTTVARLLGLSLGLLILIVIGSAAGHAWLRNQSETLRTEIIAAKRAQFRRLTQTSIVGNPPWSAPAKETLETVLGIQVSTPYALPVPVEKPGYWTFDETFTSAGDTRAIHVQFPVPASVRMLVLYQRVALILLLLATSLAVLLFIMVLAGFRRGRHEPEDQDRRAAHGAHFNSLAQLAKVSVEQGAELEKERNERLRIQEDLNFQQLLLNRSLEEKIRLGHDLHDGIIQSLYATGLTLEAAKASSESNPRLMRTQVETALKTLNTTIRDVRSYILGLAPENLRQQGFSESVKSVTETLGFGRNVEFDLRIDEQSAVLSDDQQAHLMQIVREAVSNSVRHAHAKHVSVRLQSTADEFCLLVQDDGQGFDTTSPRRGNGMTNIKARADRLKGTLSLTSNPGTGTRVVVTFPAILVAS